MTKPNLFPSYLIFVISRMDIATLMSIVRKHLSFTIEKAALLTPHNRSGMWPPSVQKVLSAFTPLLHLGVREIEKVGRDVPLPVFEMSVLEDLCSEAQRVLARADPLLHVTPPIYVVGDLHGNIFDLLRILVTAKPPPLCRFIFLGDYVDRGEFSTEVVALLFALLVAYPDHVFLLRGNHEFPSCNSVYGFRAEVEREYHSLSLYDTINHVFAWLPIAAVIGGQYFCVHGGLSPHMTTLKDFEAVKRPADSYPNGGVDDVVWSDPDPEMEESFEKSGRGSGYIFGVSAVEEFLRREGLTKIIRAHQCVQIGVQKMMSDTLYTVFSCSNYAEAADNRCGLLFIGGDLEIQMFSLPVLKQISRASANMKRVATRIPSTVLPNLDGPGLGDRKTVVSMVQRAPKLLVHPLRSHTISTSTSNRPLNKFVATPGLGYNGKELRLGLVRSHSQDHA